MATPGFALVLAHVDMISDTPHDQPSARVVTHMSFPLAWNEEIVESARDASARPDVSHALDQVALDSFDTIASSGMFLTEAAMHSATRLNVAFSCEARTSNYDVQRCSNAGHGLWLGLTCNHNASLAQNMFSDAIGHLRSL